MMHGILERRKAYAQERPRENKVAEGQRQPSKGYAGGGPVASNEGEDDQPVAEMLCLCLLVIGDKHTSMTLVARHGPDDTRKGTLATCDNSPGHDPRKLLVQLSISCALSFPPSNGQTRAPPQGAPLVLLGLDWHEEEGKPQPAVQSFLCTICAFFLGCRCYLRLKILREKLETIDYCAFAAWLCIMANFVADVIYPVWLGMDENTDLYLSNYAGKDWQVELFLKLSWSFRLTFLAAVYLCKVGILSLYLQLFPTALRVERNLLWSVIFYCGFCFTMSVLIQLLACKPAQDWAVQPDLRCPGKSVRMQFLGEWVLHITSNLMSTLSISFAKAIPGTARTLCSISLARFSLTCPLKSSVFCLPFFVIGCLDLDRPAKIGLYFVFAIGAINISVAAAWIFSVALLDHLSLSASGKLLNFAVPFFQLVNWAFSNPVSPLNAELICQCEALTAMIIILLPSLRPYLRILEGQSTTAPSSSQSSGDNIQQPQATEAEPPRTPPESAGVQRVSTFGLVRPGSSEGGNQPGNIPAGGTEAAGQSPSDSPRREGMGSSYSLPQSRERRSSARPSSRTQSPHSSRRRPSQQSQEPITPNAEFDFGFGGAGAGDGGNTRRRVNSEGEGLLARRGERRQSNSRGSESTAVSSTAVGSSVETSATTPATPPKKEDKYKYKDMDRDAPSMDPVPPMAENEQHTKGPKAQPGDCEQGQEDQSRGQDPSHSQSSRPLNSMKSIPPVASRSAAPPPPPPPPLSHYWNDHGRFVLRQGRGHGEDRVPLPPSHQPPAGLLLPSGRAVPRRNPPVSGSGWDPETGAAMHDESAVPVPSHGQPALRDLENTRRQHVDDFRGSDQDRVPTGAGQPGRREAQPPPPPTTTTTTAGVIGVARAVNLGERRGSGTLVGIPPPAGRRGSGGRGTSATNTPAASRPASSATGAPRPGGGGDGEGESEKSPPPSRRGLPMSLPEFGGRA
ncbi:hypothetical protein MKZ38_004518 [Zalerion maritima]|uniref:Rhodopsin domain-containing protein n=1 Tax=Zalerion maritima TaxID=339359 RepID=A0AAD5WPV0_9PEZI|nr:hypothetical protein MKZ38_004518 [Zalerion maritima]